MTNIDLQSNIESCTVSKINLYMNFRLYRGAGWAEKFRLLITLCNADTKQSNDSTLNQKWQQHHHTDSNHSLPTHMEPSSFWNKSKFKQNFHEDQHNIYTDGSLSKSINMQTFQDQII